MAEMTKAEFAKRCARIAKSASEWAADTLDCIDDVVGAERSETIFRFTDEMRSRLHQLDRTAGRAALALSKKDETNG